MSISWQGVFPAVTTKFKDDHSLDIAEMKTHFTRQIDAGVDGIITTGSLGEAGTLILEEKVEVARTAVEVSRGRVPVLATVVEANTARSVEFVKKAEAAGVDGFMILPAVPYVSDARETLTHFKAIAAAASKPIMIYINPVAYRVDVDLDMLAELANDPKFVAIKESSDDVRRVTRTINRFGDRYRIFCGVDNLALEALFMGADGWVAGLVDAFPEETVAIYKLFRAGRFDEALKIYRWFIPLLELDVSTKLVQNIKLAEAMAGIGNERVRPPRLPLAGEERDRVVRIIEQALKTRPTLPKL
ncbi:dihydrodipicolinate synthase family protein [Azospirillum thermophilum]|uniref:Dihydrodipicolinate synthase family protein n=1 Tax=Azospirillum thermophilum TaxID=2202148 RepID=A0A2S2CV29_9PROT|nr:dihydrodipicolinate synthase family protein [Azospirillum thermophilum]AWK88373.1 dihydrodipicolinate synthase family protein [Azospirillum thermophilum]